MLDDNIPSVLKLISYACTERHGIVAVTVGGKSRVLMTILTDIFVKPVQNCFVQQPSHIIIQNLHVISHLTPHNLCN
jgi:hypothetical protein